MAIRKSLGGKLACRYSTTLVLNKQEEHQVQGRSSHYGALSDPQQKKWTSNKNCTQEAVTGDQSCLQKARKSNVRTRPSQKGVAFKDQLYARVSALPQYSKEPVPHTRPTCIYPVCEDPPATLTPEEDNVFRNQTPLFKQKTLCSTERKNNFTKEIIHSLLRKTTFPP